MAYRKFQQYYIIGFVIILIVILLTTRKIKENFTSAADECRKISSTSDDINAASGGIAKVIDSCLSWMSPNNYIAKNQSDNVARNIINNSMTSEDITKVNTSCSNTSTVVQSNIIDTTNCKYCQENGCSVSGIRQNNKSSVNQACKINVAIELLLKKTNDSNALALAKSLQDAQGLLTSNATSTDICNVLKSDASYESYTETISTCANVYGLAQENLVNSCGPVTDIIQENTATQFQDCLLGVGITKDTTITEEVTADANLSPEQKTTGVTTTSIVISVLCSCAVSIVLSIVIYMFSQSDNAKLLITRMPMKPPL